MLFSVFMLNELIQDKDESKNQERWLLLRAKLYEEKIKAAFELFRENGIEPILIKGWAVAREYPEKYQRIYSDIDLCVAQEFYRKGLELIDRAESRQLNIDLHDGLRHLDTVRWDDLYENSRLELIDDVLVRVLRPEDHLRVLIVHWLTDGGANKERLRDLYYLIENNLETFDWERSLAVVSERRRQWICKTIGLVHKYYGLEISEFAFFEEANELPKWLTQTLEKEWAADIKLKPLHTLLGNRKELWQQFKKRFPPNAIQATIDMEGSFNNIPRLYYQIGSMFIRLKPSVRRIYNALRIKRRIGNG